MRLRYAGAVALVALAGSVVIIAGRGWLGEARVRGALLGAALAALTAIGGMALLAWSFERGARQFFGALVAGILLRLTLFGAVLVFVALRAPAAYDVVATASSLLGFYLIFQVVEVRFVLRGLKGGTT